MPWLICSSGSLTLTVVELFCCACCCRGLGQPVIELVFLKFSKPVSTVSDLTQNYGKMSSSLIGNLEYRSS